MSEFKRELMLRLNKDQKNDNDQYDLYVKLMSEVKQKIWERSLVIDHLDQEYKLESMS